MNATPLHEEPANAPEELCVCGHLRHRHADPASSDTRCLAVEDRRDLLVTFDDGRGGSDGYCGCLRFRS